MGFLWNKSALVEAKVLHEGISWELQERDGQGEVMEVFGIEVNGEYRPLW